MQQLFPSDKQPSFKKVALGEVQSWLTPCQGMRLAVLPHRQSPGRAALAVAAGKGSARPLAQQGQSQGCPGTCGSTGTTIVLLWTAKYCWHHLPEEDRILLAQ